MNKPKIRIKGFEGEWKKVKIGDVAPLTGGFAFQSGQFKTSGVPIIRISNILSSGIVGGYFVYYNEFKGDSEFRLYKGDVVIAMSGATTGKVATFEANDFGYQNQRVGKFSRTNLVNYELLSKLVSAPNFQKKIISKLTSSAQPNASSKDIDSIDLVVPEETEEQRALASYFTSLDAQIAASTSRLSSLKQIKAASLLNMFPQKGETVPRVRFKGFEGEWKDSMLSDFSYSICSGRDTAHKGIYPLYGSTGIIGTTNKPSYNGAMLLVARVGANAGKLQIINEECGVSDNTLIIKPNGNISVSWLYYYLVHCNLNHLVYGSGQPLITGYMLKRIPILLGSKKECDEIASYFTTLDAQITLHRERLEKLKQIKAACLEKMFA